MCVSDNPTTSYVCRSWFDNFFNNCHLLIWYCSIYSPSTFVCASTLCAMYNKRCRHFGIEYLNRINNNLVIHSKRTEIGNKSAYNYCATLWNNVLPSELKEFSEVSYDSFKSKVSGWLLNLRDDIYVRDFKFHFITELNFSHRFRHCKFLWLF
jgi:hypothetical protein